MRSKWSTLMISFATTFVVALVLGLGGVYFGIYYPHKKALGGEAPAIIGPPAGPPEAAGPDAPAATVDAAGIRRGAEPARKKRSPARKKPTHRQPPRPGASRRGVEAPGEPGPEKGIEGMRAKGNHTRTYRGVLLSSPDEEILDLLRKASAELAPKGRDSGLASIVQRGDMVAITLVEGNDLFRESDPEDFAEMLAGMLRGSLRKGTSVTIAMGDEMVAKAYL